MNALHSVPTPVDPTRGSAILHHIHSQNWPTVASHLRTKRSARRRVRAPSPDGVTVLHCAAWLGGAPAEVIELLVKAHPRAVRGVDSSWGFTPLHMATYSDRATVDAVEALVRAYPSACKIRDGQKLTPLHRVCLVASSNLHALLRVLLQADPSQVSEGIRNPDRDRPFHLVMARAHYELQRTRCEALREEGRAYHEEHEMLESIVEGAFLCRKVEMILEEDEVREEREALERWERGFFAPRLARKPWVAPLVFNGGGEGEGEEAAAAAGETVAAAAAAAEEVAAGGEEAAAADVAPESPTSAGDGGGEKKKRKKLRPKKLKRKMVEKVKKMDKKVDEKLLQIESKLGIQRPVEVEPPAPLDRPLTFPDREERAIIFRASLLKAECPNVRLFLFLALWNYPELAAAELNDYDDDDGGGSNDAAANEFSYDWREEAPDENVSEDMEAYAVERNEIHVQIEEKAQAFLRQPTDIADDIEEDFDDELDGVDDEDELYGDTLHSVEEDEDEDEEEDDELCEDHVCPYDDTLELKGTAHTRSCRSVDECQCDGCAAGAICQDYLAHEAPAAPIRVIKPVTNRHSAVLTAQEEDAELEEIIAEMRACGIKNPMSSLPNYDHCKPPTLLHAALSRAKSSVGDAHWCVGCRRGLVDPHFVSQDTGESCDVTCAHRYVTRGELKEMRRAAGIGDDDEEDNGAGIGPGGDVYVDADEDNDGEEVNNDGIEGNDANADADADVETEGEEVGADGDGGQQEEGDDGDEADDDEADEEQQQQEEHAEGADDAAAADGDAQAAADEDDNDHDNAEDGETTDGDDNGDAQEDQQQQEENDNTQEQEQEQAQQQQQEEEEDPNEETTWYRTCRDRLYKDITITMPYGNIIARLASMYPQSSSLPFPAYPGENGKPPRLPLHAAVAGGHTWYGGVQAVVRAYPPALSMLDPFLRIYPFMAAAMRKPNPPDDDDWERKRYFSELTTCYELLRELPELVTRHI